MNNGESGLISDEYFGIKNDQDIFYERLEL